MNNYNKNNIKVGLMVSLALLVLVISFYVIGKKQNLFGSSFELKVRFSQLDGLNEGNNVLFSGLQAGTVKNIHIINDTTMEVILSIDEKIKPFIHKNALASIGSAGFIGNKIVNIMPGKGTSPIVNSGDRVNAEKPVNTAEMLNTLSRTNNNIAQIAATVKGAVTRVDSSDIFKLINDKDLGVSIRSTFGYINRASASADNMMRGLNEMVMQIRKGKGTAGKLLSDTSFAYNLRETLSKIESASDNANQLIVKLNYLADNLNKDIYQSKGTLHTLLQDSVTAKNLSMSMYNIEKGTEGFNQNMEALKHNFLLRGYYRRQARQQKKERQKANTLTEQNTSETK